MTKMRPGRRYSPGPLGPVRGYETIEHEGDEWVRVRDFEDYLSRRADHDASALFEDVRKGPEGRNSAELIEVDPWKPIAVLCAGAAVLALLVILALVTR